VMQSSLKRLKLGLVSIVMAMAAIMPFVGASASAATVYCGEAYPTWGWANCYYNGSWSGGISDSKTDGYCVEIKWKTSSGAWTTSGVVGNPACNLNQVTLWSLSSSHAVYGIRLYNGNGNYSTLCATYSACRS
jgi:hypothetical protein